MLHSLAYAGPGGAKELAKDLRKLADLLEADFAILESIRTNSQVQQDDWPAIEATIIYRHREPFGISLENRDK